MGETSVAKFYSESQEGTLELFQESPGGFLWDSSLFPKTIISKLFIPNCLSAFSCYPHSVWGSGKESTFQCRRSTGDLGSNPGSRRSPGRGTGHPLQYSCLENNLWTEEPGGLQSTGLQRVGHNWPQRNETYSVGPVKLEREFRLGQWCLEVRSGGTIVLVPLHTFAPLFKCFFLRLGVS